MKYIKTFKNKLNESIGLLRASDWQSNDIDKVKSIIKNRKRNKNFDIDVRDWNHCTPLINAAQNNNLEMVKVLIDAGANVNVKTRDSYSPLIGAAYKKNLEMTLLLIDSGVDWIVKHRNSTDTPAYFYEILPEKMQKIVREKYPEKYDELKKIIDKEKIIQTEYNKGAELMNAAGSNKVDKVKELINKGVNVNIKYNPLLSNGGNNYKNRTPLLFVLKNIFRSVKTPQIVDALIKAGANLDAQEDDIEVPQ